MFRQHIQWHSAWVDSALLVVLGLALMGWLSPQVWTFQGTLPITPQSLIVVLWGVLWGWQVGTAAVALYLVAGGLGAPVFADGASGWVHFTGSTAGFLFAFPIGALVAGWFAAQVTRMRYGASALLLLLGQLVIVLLGSLPTRHHSCQVPLVDSLLDLMPPLLVKAALGTLIVVFVGRGLTGHKPTPEGS